MVKKIDKIGEEKINSFGSLMKIINYDGWYNITIYFPEYNWIGENFRYDHFKNGLIKCPYEPRVFGIGYIGEGIYTSRVNGKKTKCYLTWQGMIRRCYDEKSRNKYPTYKDCIVCDEWLNFQNFVKWYNDNFYEVENEQMELDKDILYKGNKVYSPETCIFTPSRINVLFVTNKERRGNLPIGVVRISSGRYRAHIQFGNGSIMESTVYDTIEEAFSIYKEYKENWIKEVANEYRDKIPEKLYNAMCEYEFEITD